MSTLNDLEEQLQHLAQGDGLIVALTGAGISAESGIPTFRGSEGYWTIGSKQYQPMEMATFEMFRALPHEVWSWYLYRRGVCRTARPNEGHQHLAHFENVMKDRFLLVTQNVDGLHLRAGNTRKRTFQIHGNIDYMRCAQPCSDALHAVPAEFDTWPKSKRVDKQLLHRLRCEQCGDLMRPHVLWFDECYDEKLFHFESSIAAAHRAQLIVTIGTSGATNLPNQMVYAATHQGALLVDINPEHNPFGRAADRLARGCHIRLSASEGLGILATILGMDGVP